MSEPIAPVCPRCKGFIPNNETPGAYPGALSRTDNETYVCSACGQCEAMEQFLLGAPMPQVGWDIVTDLSRELVTALEEWRDYNKDVTAEECWYVLQAIITRYLRAGVEKYVLYAPDDDEPDEFWRIKDVLKVLTNE